MDKKVTIHDIAREAGVSAATVSYIINNRTDKSISEKTRQHVLHIINLYNYKPAAFAKNLRSTPDFKLIALFFGENKSALYGGEFQYFSRCLSLVFPGDKYGFVLCNPPYRRIEQADAIIAYNTDLKSFREIAEANYVPLIAVDCIPNDTLFFQVTTDYEKLKIEAQEKFGKNYTFVAISPLDESVKSEARNSFNEAVFINSLSELKHITTGNNIVTTDKVIAEYFNTDKCILFPETLAEEKCRQVLSCMERVLQRIPFDTHFYKI